MDYVGFRHSLFLALLALPSWGAAVSLRYEAPPDLRCPDETALRQLVAARLGSDPFLPEAASVVTVKVQAGAPVQAEVALESPGAPTRRKTLSGGDCTELMQSVAVTVALVVDPVIKRAEPVAVPEPVIIAPAPPPPAPVAPPAEAPAFH